MKGSVLQEALDHLSFINWQISPSEGSNRKALEGARTELMTIIQVAMTRECRTCPAIEKCRRDSY